MTLPTSTTNITGLPIILRGLSFRNESQSARRTIFHSQTAFDLAISASESLACSHLQVFKDRSQAQGRKECQRAHNQDYAHQQHAEQRCRNRKCAERRWHVFLARQTACDSQHGNYHEKASNQSVQSKRGVVIQRVDAQTAKGGSVIRGC